MRPWPMVLMLGACASAPLQGSFLRGHYQAQSELAGEATRKLSGDYDPKTVGTFYMQGSTDPFGRGLAEGLRDAGFTVREPEVDAGQSSSLVYIVDSLKGSSLLRLTLVVRGRVLSRAYAERRTGVVAVGPWCSGRLQ